MTVTAGTGTLKIDANSTFTSGGKTVNNLTITNAITVTLGDDATVSGTLLFDDNAQATQTINSNNINAQGTITVGSGANQSITVAGTATLKVNGSGAQAWNSNFESTWHNLVTLPVVIDKSGGTLTFNDETHFGDAFTFTQGSVDFGSSIWGYYGGANLTYTAGSLTVGTSEMAFGTCTIPSGFLTATGDLYKVTFGVIGSQNYNGSPTITLGGDMTITNTTTAIGSGSDTATINSNNVNIQGDLLISARGNQRQTIAGTANINFTGGAAQSWTMNNESGFENRITNDLTFNKSGNTLTCPTPFGYSSGTMTYTAGTIDWSTNSVEVTFFGTCTIDADGMSFYDVDFTSGTSTLTSNADIDNNVSISGGTFAPDSFQVNVGNNWTLSSGSFTKGTSTVVIE